MIARSIKDRLGTEAKRSTAGRSEASSRYTTCRSGHGGRQAVNMGRMGSLERSDWPAGWRQRRLPVNPGLGVIELRKFGKSTKKGQKTCLELRRHEVRWFCGAKMRWVG